MYARILLYLWLARVSDMNRHTVYLVPGMLYLYVSATILEQTLCGLLLVSSCLVRVCLVAYSVYPYVLLYVVRSYSKTIPGTIRTVAINSNTTSYSPAG